MGQRSLNPTRLTYDTLWSPAQLPPCPTPGLHSGPTGQLLPWGFGHAVPPAWHTVPSPLSVPEDHTVDSKSYSPYGFQLRKDASRPPHSIQTPKHRMSHCDTTACSPFASPRLPRSSWCPLVGGGEGAGLTSHLHDRSWMMEVKMNLCPCLRRKSWSRKSRKATQQRMVDRIMVAWTTCIMA